MNRFLKATFFAIAMSPSHQDASIDLTEVHCKCLAQQVLQGLGASLGVDGVVLGL
jgi:hypothetical protein